MLFRLFVIVLLALATWAAEPAPLAHFTSTGGLTPDGPGRFEMKIYADGRLSWYELQTRSWHQAHITEEELKSLREAVGATGPVTPDENATRPSAHDGQDVTVVLSTKEGPRILELWKLRKAKLPVVDLLRQLRQRYAHK